MSFYVIAVKLVATLEQSYWPPGSILGLITLSLNEPLDLSGLLILFLNDCVHSRGLRPYLGWESNE